MAKLIRTSTTLQTTISITLSILIVLGIGLRYLNLAGAPYWVDETTNSMHSAGYSKQEVQSDLFSLPDTELLTITELRPYQNAALSERTAINTVKVLGVGEPQSPPIFYLLERLWDRVLNLDNISIVAKRILPVSLSLLGLPCMYWLCLELFGSKRIALLATALLATSPVQFLYAREVRMYSLWVVEILLINAIFLWALRKQKRRCWGLYTAASTLSVYTFPLTLFFTAAHGLYLLVTDRSLWSTRISSFWRNASFKYFCGSVLATMLLFLPWIRYIRRMDEHDMADWRAETFSAARFLGAWSYNLVQVFFEPLQSDPTQTNSPVAEGILNPGFFFLCLSAIVVFGLFIFAIFRLIQRREYKGVIFVLLVTGLPFLTLAIPDLVIGGQRSTIERYLLGSILGMQIAIAAWLGDRQPSSDRLSGQTSARPGLGKNLVTLLMIVLPMLGLASCFQIAYNPPASHHRWTENNREIANIIANNPDTPLFWAKSQVFMFLTLSYELDPSVTLRPLDPEALPTDLDCQSRETLFLSSKASVVPTLEAQCQASATNISEGNLSLWRLTPSKDTQS